MPRVVTAPPPLETVTKPGVVSNTAMSPNHWSARVALALVQLVIGAAVQVPVPPTIVPVGAVVLPFQNWRRGPVAAAATIFTWLAMLVCTARSAGR